MRPLAGGGRSKGDWPSTAWRDETDPLGSNAIDVQLRQAAGQAAGRRGFES